MGDFMKKKQKKDSMGDISLSELPEDIIHEILGRFESTKQAGVSIFCKTWYSAWITNPILYFPTGNKLDFIGRTLRRYQEKRIHIENLVIQGIDHSISVSVPVPPVDEWIRIAVQNGVKSLWLGFRAGCEQREYTLYNTVFEANSLKELRLKNVRLTMKMKTDKVIMFNHLKKLLLKRINIDDHMFEAIMANCCLIEILVVEECVSLKRIKVTKHYKLNTIEVKVGAFGPETKLDVEIEAPNLEHLDLRLRSASLKLSETNKLRYLYLLGYIDLSATSFLDNWEHKFPKVELLSLSRVMGYRRINLSSHSLKCIQLSSEELKEVTIDAPNLVSLELGDILDLSLTNAPNMVYMVLYTVLNLSLTNAPTQWELKIRQPCFHPLGTDDFCKLKRLLAKATHSKISIEMGICDQTCYFVDVGRIPTTPIVQVEDVHLHFSFSTDFVQSNFLEALFLTCHPNTIIVKSNPFLVCFLSQKLIERRKRENKSWSKELKEVQREIYDDNIQQWHPTEWRSLPKKKKQRANVRFRLQWKT